MPLDFDSINERARRKQEAYIVLRELERKALPGWGDVEFEISYLCINRDGERCIVHEEYIQYNRSGPQGFCYIEDGNLCSWDLEILSSDEEQVSRQKETYRENAHKLIRPPLAVKLKDNSDLYLKAAIDGVPGG